MKNAYFCAVIALLLTLPCEAAEPPSLSVPQMYAGMYLTGITNTTYEIQYVTNMTNTNMWVALTNITLTESPWFFIDYGSSQSLTRYYRIVEIGPPPPGMVRVAAGPFVMGDTFSETNNSSYSEVPVHTVMVSEFYIDCTEVSEGLWNDVYSWATNHGYEFDNRGSYFDGVDYSIGTNHPIVLISWFDMVKWCNARSEKAGLTPAYYTDETQTTVYRVGKIDWYGNQYVKWDCGYRLPTEAEWEKAARGGLVGKRFPWGDIISLAKANYNSWWGSYNESLGMGINPIYRQPPPWPCTAPVDAFEPNGYGLYNMAGNVTELCWDFMSDGYDGPWASVPNPRGLEQSFAGGRVGRGATTRLMQVGAGCQTDTRTAPAGIS